MKTKQKQKNIPDGWEFYTLNKIGEFKNGVNKSKEDFGHGSPFVNLMDIFGFSSIRRKKFGSVNVSKGEIQNYNLLKGDVLFVRSSVKPEGVGLATLIEEDLEDTVYSGFIIRFRSNKELLFHDYKKYCFQNPMFRNKLLSVSSVSANTNINQESLNKLSISLPVIVEQKKIVSVLETWDCAIEKLGRKIEIKKNIKKGLMQRLLTGEMRLPGFSEKWQIVKLGEIAEIKKGVQLNKIELHDGGKYPAYSGGVTPSGFTDNWNTEENTIIVSEGGNSCGYVNFIDQKFWAGGHCYVIIEKEINKIYLHQYLKFSQVLLMRLRVGSGLPNVQKKHIENFTINLPKIKEQISIAEVLITADKEIETLESQLFFLKDQKKYLLNNLITGKIRTPESIK